MVDDQPMVRRLLAHLFSAEGYEVVEAEDGRWALEALGGTTPPEERLGLRERQRAVAEGLTSRSGRRRAG